MTLPPERAAELAKSPKAHKWKMIKAKVSRFFLLVVPMATQYLIT